MLAVAIQWDILRSQHLPKELSHAALEAAASPSPEKEIEYEEHEMVVHVLAMAMLLGSVTAKTTLICQKPGQNHPKITVHLIVSHPTRPKVCQRCESSVFDGA